jgi:hypothetical protein
MMCFIYSPNDCLRALLTFAIAGRLIVEAYNLVDWRATLASANSFRYDRKFQAAAAALISANSERIRFTERSFRLNKQTLSQ